MSLFERHRSRAGRRCHWLTRAGGGPLTVACPGFDCSLDRIAAHAPSVLGATRGETDLISIELTFERSADVAGVERPGNHLERLFERKLSLRQLPCAFCLCRHDPEIGRAV